MFSIKRFLKTLSDSKLTAFYDFLMVTDAHDYDTARAVEYELERRGLPL